MRFVSLASFLTFLAITDTAAQELPVQPGQQVRVTVSASGARRYRDAFREFRGDTLVLASAALPLAEVTRFDVYAGRHGHPWRGAAIGGAVVGVAAFPFWSAFCTGVSESGGCHEYGAVTGLSLLSAAGGAVIGGVIGALIKTDKWHEVPIDRLQVSVMPQLDSALALGLSVKF